MSVVIIQSLLNKFGGSVEQVWRWFLPTLIPTLALILSVLIVDFRAADGSDKLVSRFLYRLALGLSCGYLVVVALTFVIQAWVSTPIVELMQLSDFWLEPLQGLVAMALGVFFLKGEEGQTEPKSHVADD